MSKKELNDFVRNAIENCNLFSVIRGIEDGADVNTRLVYGGYTLLMKAVFNLDLAMIQYLINKGADPTLKDTYDNDFFLYAISMTTESKVNCEKNERIQDFVRSADLQDFIINKFPSSITLMFEHNILHYIIKERYKHLLTGSELNLL